MSTQSVLVIDDDDGLSTLIGREFTSVGWRVRRAASAYEGLELLRAELPDLIFLDVGLPDADGMDICRRIRANPVTSRVPIIMVTARTLEADRVEGLDRGADDYIGKPFAVRELAARARAVLRRTGRLAEPLATRDLQIDIARRTVTAGGREVTLRAREFDLLARLASEPERVFRREELLTDVWGLAHPTEILTRTIDVHVRRLRMKLGDAGNHLDTVKGVGYRFKTVP
jgi:DNA-binding response OmpR family regulator